MTARKGKRRARRTPKSISTDAALVATTLFKFALDLAENDEAKNAVFSPFINSLKGTTVFAPRKMTRLLEKAIASAYESSADFLARVEFAERLFNRLNFDDPKYVVAFLYCLMRLAPDSVNSQKPFEELKAHFGKYWRWPFVWTVSLQFEIVRRRYEEEAARGDLFVTRWRDEYQKYANNLWAEEKRKSKQIAVRKKMMVDSFRSHPIVKKLINQSRSSTLSKP
jgi:hypothetical protein